MRKYIFPPTDWSEAIKYNTGRGMLPTECVKEAYYFC